LGFNVQSLRIYSNKIAAGALGRLVPRVLDKNSSHRLGGRREEMAARIPVFSLLNVH
jgi:hypothetical protein